MHLILCTTLLTNRANERQEIWSQHYPALYLFSLHFMNIATAMWLLGPQVLCSPLALTITFCLQPLMTLEDKASSIMPQFPSTVALPLTHNTFYRSLGVNNSQKERESWSVLAHCSLSHQRTNSSYDGSNLLSRQLDYRNWSYSDSEQYKRIFIDQSIMSYWQMETKLPVWDVSILILVKWLADFSIMPLLPLLRLYDNQIACQTRRSCGRLIRRWRVNQIRGVVKRHYFQLKTWVESVMLLLSNRRMFWLCRKKMQHTKRSTTTEKSSISEGSSWWFNEVACVLDISSVWAFNACWQPQYEA